MSPNGLHAFFPNTSIPPPSRPLFRRSWPRPRPRRSVVRSTPGGKADERRDDQPRPAGLGHRRAGYRYEARHPITGALLAAYSAGAAGPLGGRADGAPPPDACLVNLYRAGARMGAHQDRDEADFSAFRCSRYRWATPPMFRLGGLDRRAPTVSMRLASGDVCILAGTSAAGVPRRRSHPARLLASDSRRRPPQSDPSARSPPKES